MKVTYQTNGKTTQLNTTYIDVSIQGDMQPKTAIWFTDKDLKSADHRMMETPIISIHIEGHKLFNGTFDDLKKVINPDKPTPDKTFFLFGQAARVYDESDIHEVVRQYEDNIIQVDTFVFTEGETTPQSLISAYDGWVDWTTISEEEFNLL